MGRPICGRGIFEACREMQTASSSSHWRPWKQRVGLSSQGLSIWSVFPLQVFHSPNIFKLGANKRHKAKGKKAQGESKDSVGKVKLLR